MKLGDLTSSLRLWVTLWSGSALALFAAIAAAGSTHPTKQIDPIQIDVGPDSVLFATTTKPANIERFYVRVAGPEGRLFERTTNSAVVNWRPNHTLKEGTVYKFHAHAVRKTGVRPVSRGVSSYAQRKNAGVRVERGEKGSTSTIERMGTLHVENGALQLARLARTDAGQGTAKVTAGVGTKAQSFSDEVTIEGSAPDLLLDDTDSSGTQDVWTFVSQDTANSVSINSIEGANSRPFVIENTDEFNSLYISSSGDIGMGTNTPSQPLHLFESGSIDPLFRLENTDASNQTVWDLFHRDDGSFSIEGTSEFEVFTLEGGAPADSLRVASSGNVGVGAPAPGKRLHLQGSDAGRLGQNNIMLRAENVSGTQEPRRMIELINNGSPLLVYRDTSRGSIWNMSPVGNSFAISLTGTGAQEFRMDGSGNLTIQGMLTENSMRSEKRDFASIDSQTVLAKLGALPIKEWAYRHSPKSRHVGPMAKKFQATFGLGSDGGVAPHDMAGIALAAAKALRTRTSELKLENQELRKDNRELRARLKRIESHLDFRE